MIPYGQHSIEEEDIEAVVEALRSERITQGQYVDEFENALSDHFGCNHAIAVNNGTTALFLAHKALGVSDGNEVLTTPNTFVATANGIVFNDGRPRFLDIHPETFNLDIDRLEEYLSKPDNRDDVVGITPVHFAGLPCDMEKIWELADEYDLFVLEDACHAPGAQYRDRKGNWHKIGSCSHSDAAILSFHPVKHITTGEGGAILTNDPDLADSVRKLRHHGISKTPEDFVHKPNGPWYYEMQELGINGRITDFQCALGIEQLHRLDERVEKRQAIADEYFDALTKIEEIQTPDIDDKSHHSFHLFVILAKQKEELFSHLRDSGISPQVHYIPVHRHPYYQDKYDYSEGDFPYAESYYQAALSLPMFPGLSEDDMNHVIQTLQEFYE